MGAMTMVFEDAHKAVLSKLKAGDAITFTADNIGGQLSARDVKIKK
jgi:Cu/Ag efflux protein CusF